MKGYLVACTMLASISMFSCKKNPGSSTTHDDVVQEIQLNHKNQEENDAIRHSIADTTAFVAPSPAYDVVQSGGPVADWDKKIIKTANITLELRDFNSYNGSLYKRIKNFGAYIAGEEQVQSDERIENVVTLKVPVLQFEELINSFNGEGIKVISRRISTEDATGEVVDTKARIDAKKQVRARYMELLKQAKSMKDILQVQEEINAIQEELETADGRVKYLTNQASYSTINLVYYQYINGATGNSRERSFFAKLQEAFRNGGYIISSVILFVVTIWPILIGGFMIWLVVKRWKYAALSSAKKV